MGRKDGRVRDILARLLEMRHEENRLRDELFELTYGEKRAPKSRNSGARP